jgi:hypothetical protein
VWGKGKEKVNEDEFVRYILSPYMKIETMKPVAIVLRRGCGMMENDGRGKSKIYGKHLCNYHDVSHHTTIIY